MKHLITAIGMVLVTMASADAQQPATPADPHHPQGQTQTPAPKAGPPAGGMMPMMDMCRDMMSGAGMMGPGMTGGAPPTDPKMMAQMMEMRGEMMKAMGEIMMKHAKKMDGASTGHGQKK